MSLRKMKAGYAVVAGIGVLFVVLGISSIVYFFTVKQVMGQSTSIYGNYFVAGILCLVFAVAILRITVPAFIPLKKNNFVTIRTCPYCGAIVDKADLSCKKCKQQLD